MIVNEGLYHYHRISLILHPMFAKCLITLSISTALGSWIANRICIQLVTAIVLHPQNALLHPLPALWLSLSDKFVCYMNCAFSMTTDPAMWLLGTKPSANINEWGMTPEHASSCVCEELKHSLHESRHLDDATQIVPLLNCSQDHVTRTRKPSKPIYIFTLPAHLTYNLQGLGRILLTSATTNKLPWMIYSIHPSLDESNKNSISTAQLLTTIGNLQSNVMPCGCQIRSLQMLIQSKCHLCKFASGLRILMLQSANCQQQPRGFGRIWVASQYNR